MKNLTDGQSQLDKSRGEKERRGSVRRYEGCVDGDDRHFEDKQGKEMEMEEGRIAEGGEEADETQAEMQWSIRTRREEKGW